MLARAKSHGILREMIPGLFKWELGRMLCFFRREWNRELHLGVFYPRILLEMQSGMHRRIWCPGKRSEQMMCESHEPER